MRISATVTPRQRSGRALRCAVAFLLCLTPALVCADDLKFSRGDLDDNGQIDQADVLAAIGYLNQGEALDVLEAMDVVDDGVLDRNDAAAIAQLAFFPISVSFPSELVIIDRGDVNGDGVLDEADARILNAYLRNLVSLEVAIDAADVDDNGVLDRRDQAALDNLISESGGFSNDGPEGSIDSPDKVRTRTSPTRTPGGGRVIDRLHGEGGLTYVPVPASGPTVKRGSGGLDSGDEAGISKRPRRTPGVKRTSGGLDNGVDTSGISTTGQKSAGGTKAPSGGFDAGNPDTGTVSQGPRTRRRTPTSSPKGVKP